MDTQFQPVTYDTVAEFGVRLQVSRGTVFAWIRAGLPSFRVGRTRRIIRQKADLWLEAGGADRTRTSKRARRVNRSSGIRS
jgi:excisionase family DNA binding protein